MAARRSRRSSLGDSGAEIKVARSEALETCPSFELRSERWHIRRGRRADELTVTATLVINDLEGSWKIAIAYLQAESSNPGVTWEEEER